MADKIDVALSDVELLHGSAQACLSGCPGDLDWEARASQPSAVVGRTTDCRFALAALATSPVCSLQKKLQGVEVLLSPHYRTPRRRMTARFGTGGLDENGKDAIRSWVKAVHRLRRAAMPPPFDRQDGRTSDEQLFDWLEHHLTDELRTVSKQRWLYLPRSLFEKGKTRRRGHKLELKQVAADLAIKWLEWFRARTFDLRHAGEGRGLGMFALENIDRKWDKKPVAPGKVCL